MSKNISVEAVLKASTGIEKVWEDNPDITLGKNSADKVALKDYQAAIKAVEDRNTKIGELRHQLDGLLDERDDAARLLSGYNTRALSAIRGIFGPDSAEYDQAGGTRTSDRKLPSRKTKTLAKAA